MFGEVLVNVVCVSLLIDVIDLYHDNTYILVITVVVHLGYMPVARKEDEKFVGA